MDKNIDYEYHSIIFCIKCKRLMYINNYYNHLNTKIHKQNLEKKNLYYNKQNKKSLVKFN